MKLNKKLFSSAIAAAMVLGSVSAMAAEFPTEGLGLQPGYGATVQPPAGTGVVNGFTNNTVQVPAYVNPATSYANATDLYNKGFYFEAHAALEQIPAVLNVYEAATVADFMRTIELACDRVIIDEAFADVEAYMANGYYAEASNILINDVFSLSQFGPTGSPITSTFGATETLYHPESFTLADWEKARKLEAEIGNAMGMIVYSKDAAIRRVEFMYGPLPDEAWYDVVEVGTRYDVYVQLELPSGDVVTIGEVDIANDGAILVDTLGDWVELNPIWDNPVEY